MGEHVTASVVLDVGVVLLLAAAAGWAAHRTGIPSVVGYLVVGIAVSPFTRGYVADRAQIAILAAIGVVLLLFEVGIEVDVARITRESRALLVVGPLQIALGTFARRSGAVVARDRQRSARAPRSSRGQRGRPGRRAVSAGRPGRCARGEP